MKGSGVEWSGVELRIGCFSFVSFSFLFSFLLAFFSVVGVGGGGWIKGGSHDDFWFWSWFWFVWFDLIWTLLGKKEGEGEGEGEMMKRRINEDSLRDSWEFAYVYEV